MLKDAVAVIDIGSSKITGLIGENGVNNNFLIRAHCETPTFALGGEIGEIDSPEDLRRAIGHVLSSITSSARATVSKIYFSVPGDFLVVKNCSLQMYLNRTRRLKSNDVDEYLRAARKSLAVSGYELIAQSGVQYYLDGQKKVTRLTGNVTASIDGMTTFYFAKQSFTKAVREILRSMGVKEVEFVPVPFAEAFLLFTENERFAFEVLLDVGSSVSNFSIIYGGGVLYNASFNVGGGYISGYLMQKLRLPTYELAEKLKRKLNLTLPHDYNGIYEVSDGNEVFRFPQRKCNEVAEYVITKIAEMTDRALNESKVRLPGGFSISLTGGGITYVRGAREALFGAVEIPVNVVCPKVSYMAKPEETSKMAVLNYALNYKGV